MVNRHPVDELAEIRAERRRLAEREDVLRRQLLEPGADLEGDAYCAHIHRFEREELNRAALERRFGEAAVAACLRPVRYQIVAVNRRAAPALVDVEVAGRF
jgi:hypothetical protein